MTRINKKASIRDSVLVIGKTETINDSSIKIDFDLNKFFAHYVDEQLGSLIENYSPVVQRQIGVEQCKGVRIRGSFRTDFSSLNTNGYDGMCYITVRRNSIGKALVHCGYGIAFRPSFPDADIAGVISGSPTYDSGANTYDLPMQPVLDVGFSTSGGMAYYSDSNIKGIIFYYGARSGDNLIDCAFPENVTPVDTGTVNLAGNNVFVVDNDLIGSDIYNNNVIEYDSGVMAYLTSGVSEINPDTLYYYQITIGSNNAISLLISEDPDTMGSEVIGFGAYTPLSEYLETANMDAFGVGVDNTRGYRWEFGDITIANISGEYPVAYFKMDAALMPEEFMAHIRGRGYGYDASSPVNGLNLYIYNIFSSSWELLVTNTYSDMTSSNLVTVSNGIKEDATHTYKDGSNIVQFYVTTMYPSGDADEEALLEIDYFKLIASVNSSLNIGGCADAYIDDPNLVKETTGIFTPSGNYYAITEFEDRAIAWIDDVYIVISEVRYKLLEGLDYFWHVNDENYRGSSRIRHSIRFNTSITGDIEIDFWYSPMVVVAQSHIEDDYVSFSGQDVLAKHMGIHMLTVTSDGVDIPALVKEYVDTLEKVNEKYILRWDYLREYILQQQSITTLVIVDNYRVDGVLKQQEISKINEYIEIDRTETFKLRELLDA